MLLTCVYIWPQTFAVTNMSCNCATQPCRGHRETLQVFKNAGKYDRITYRRVCFVSGKRLQRLVCSLAQSSGLFDRCRIASLILLTRKLALAMMDYSAGNVYRSRYNFVAPYLSWKNIDNASLTCSQGGRHRYRNNQAASGACTASPSIMRSQSKATKLVKNSSDFLRLF